MGSPQGKFIYTEKRGEGDIVKDSKYPLWEWVPAVRKVDGLYRQVLIRRRLVPSGKGRKKSVYDVRVVREKAPPHPSDQARLARISEEYREIVSDYNDLDENVRADAQIDDPVYEYEDLDAFVEGHAQHFSLKRVKKVTFRMIFHRGSLFHGLPAPTGAQRRGVFSLLSSQVEAQKTNISRSL